MDVQTQDTQLLTFSFSSLTTNMGSKLTIGLDTLEQRHSGVKAFLSECVLTNCPIAIRQIKVSDKTACVYIIENTSGIKLVLKALPRNMNDVDDPLTEISFTRVSSDILVSPEIIKLHPHFILLSYIGRDHTVFMGSAPILFLDCSFVAVLKRLNLLHGASIIPKKKAFTDLDRLALPASQKLIEKHLVLNRCFKSIQEVFAVLDVASSAHPVFIHANITPSNIVENPQESYLIDWGRYPGQGNPYFDLGAVFAMYGLEDELKLQLIRKHYPDTLSNKLPKDDRDLLKVLNLFSAIYWFKMVVSIIDEAKLDPNQILTSHNTDYSNHDFVKKVANYEINMIMPSGQIELVKTALYEAQKRIENLNSSNRCTF